MLYRFTLFGSCTTLVETRAVLHRMAKVICVYWRCREDVRMHWRADSQKGTAKRLLVGALSAVINAAVKGSCKRSTPICNPKRLPIGRCPDLRSVGFRHQKSRSGNCCLFCCNNDRASSKGCAGCAPSVTFRGEVSQLQCYLTP